MKAVKKINEVFGQTARGFSVPPTGFPQEKAPAPQAAKIQPANDHVAATTEAPNLSNATSDRRDAMAGSMLADMFLGAVLGLPTVDFAGADLDVGHLVDAADEFMAEIRKPAQPEPAQEQQPVSYLSSMFSSSATGKSIKEVTVEPWMSWMVTPSAPPAPVM